MNDNPNLRIARLCPWCGLECAHSMVIDVSRGEFRCFSCRSEGNLYELLHEEIGEGKPLIDHTTVYGILSSPAFSSCLDRRRMFSNSKMVVTCPIHGEKTPSMMVDQTENRFSCFGCSASGGPNDLMYHLYVSMSERSISQFHIREPTDDVVA